MTPDADDPRERAGNEWGDDDPRFTVGLALDVASVLEAHGHHAVAAAGRAVLELQQHLHHFLYLSGSRCHGGARS